MQYINSPIFTFCVNYSNLNEQKATLISLIFFATVLWTKYIQCINKQTSPIYVVYQSIIIVFSVMNISAIIDKQYPFFDTLTTSSR